MKADTWVSGLLGHDDADCVVVLETCYRTQIVGIN